jgi:DNA-binding beta-propeller fold protein YncE
LFETVHHIRIDSSGHIWISDAAQHTVHKFAPEGKLLLTIGVSGEAGNDETHLNRPTDMAISPVGEVFVADGYGNNRVVHFDAKGRFVKSWGRMGTGPGEFSMPHSIAMDSKGQLYVAGRNNNRIQVFDQNGRLLRTFPQVMVPWNILITPKDEVYVCGSSPMRWGDRPSLGVPPKDQMVMKFDTSGRLLELWTFPVGEKPGELNWLHGIAIDAAGDLYLSDIMGERIQKFVRLPAKR